jgi:hypothetical protein
MSKFIVTFTTDKRDAQPLEAAAHPRHSSRDPRSWPYTLLRNGVVFSRRAQHIFHKEPELSFVTEGQMETRWQDQNRENARGRGVGCQSTREKPCLLWDRATGRPASFLKRSTSDRGPTTAMKLKVTNDIVLPYFPTVSSS